MPPGSLASTRESGPQDRFAQTPARDIARVVRAHVVDADGAVADLFRAGGPRTFDRGGRCAASDPRIARHGEADGVELALEVLRDLGGERGQGRTHVAPSRLVGL